MALYKNESFIFKVSVRFIIANLYILVLFSAVIFSQNNCTAVIKQSRQVINIPLNGFYYYDDDTIYNSKHLNIPDSGWVVLKGNNYNLYLYRECPLGTGCLAEILIGISDVNKSRPDRGFCLPVHTIGWRFLWEYDKNSWIEDLDNDGNGELIIWDSFPLHEDATNAEYGVVGWVYRLDLNTSNFIFDLNLSRTKIQEIADAYKKPMISSYPEKLAKVVIQNRMKCVEILEFFLDKAK